MKHLLIKSVSVYCLLIVSGNVLAASSERDASADSSSHVSWTGLSGSGTMQDPRTTADDSCDALTDESARAVAAACAGGGASGAGATAMDAAADSSATALDESSALGAKVVEGHDNPGAAVDASLRLTGKACDSECSGEGSTTRADVDDSSTAAAGVIKLVGQIVNLVGR